MYIQSTAMTNSFVPGFVFTADQWLCDTLISIGILPNLVGYHHIRRAVKLTAETNHRHDIGYIYEILSAEFDATTASIERNIRNAINCAYRAEGLMDLNKILNVDVVKSSQQALSNMQFISLLAHYYSQKDYQLTHFKRTTIIES